MRSVGTRSHNVRVLHDEVPVSFHESTRATGNGVDLGDRNVTE